MSLTEPITSLPVYATMLMAPATSPTTTVVKPAAVDALNPNAGSAPDVLDEEVDEAAAVELAGLETPVADEAEQGQWKSASQL